MLRSLFHELEVTTLGGTALYAVEYDPSDRWLLSVDSVTNVSLLCLSNGNRTILSMVIDQRGQELS
jgi:hypothetical protein